MVLFSISICLSSLGIRWVVLLDLVVVGLIVLVALFDLFHEIFEDGDGGLEELVIDGGYFFVKSLHIVLEEVLLLAQEGRYLLVFQQLFLHSDRRTSQNYMVALKFSVLD